MALEDTLNFLDEVREIRAYNLKMNKDELSERSEYIHINYVKGRFLELSEKYPNLEILEKGYLESLKKANEKVNAKLKSKFSKKELIILDLQIKDIKTLGS